MRLESVEGIRTLPRVSGREEEVQGLRLWSCVEEFIDESAATREAKSTNVVSITYSVSTYHGSVIGSLTCWRQSRGR